MARLSVCQGAGIYLSLLLLGVVGLIFSVVMPRSNIFSQGIA
jgi:hypothetical protein